MQKDITGTWNGFVDWNCTGTIYSAGAWTFKADGTWTYAWGGGRWLQVGCMVYWNFDNAAGLIYTANVGHNSIQGIMGYPESAKGCFYALPQNVTPNNVDADATIGPVKM